MRVVAFSACLAVVSLSATVQAEEQRNTVLVMHAGYDSMTVRLNAELIALGYHPVPIHYPPRKFSIEEVTSIIKAHRAVALINTTMMGDGVDIWIVDPGNGAISRAETMDSNGGDHSEASTFLKAVELIRAKLMKIDGPVKAADKTIAERESAREATIPPATNQSNPAEGSAAKDYRRFTMAIGPSVSYGFSELPATVQVMLGVHVRLIGRVGLSIVGLPPSAPSKVETRYGSAQVWNSAIVGGLNLDLLSPDHRWIPWIGVLVGPHFSSTAGQGVLPYTSDSARMLVTLVCLRVGLNVVITERLALQAVLHTEWALPRPVIRVGEELIPWGNPLFGGALALVVNLI
jgi:hypothetical protein